MEAGHQTKYFGKKIIVIIMITVYMVFLQEKILQAVTGTTDFRKSPDLVLTEDFTGVNAGAILS